MENKERLELKTKSFVTDLLAGVHAEESFRKNINYLLREIGLFTHAERVCVYEHGGDRSRVEKVFQWEKKDNSIVDLEGIFLEKEDIGDWYSRLGENQLVVLPDVDAIKGSLPVVYDEIRGMGVGSLLLIPANVQNKLLACVCVVNPDFNSFAVAENAISYLGRQIGVLYHRERVSHKYQLFMDGMRASNLSEFIVDCASNRFEAFRITKVLRNSIPENGDWDWLRQYYATIIKPEYREDLLRRTSRDYIRTFLSTEQSTYTIDLERSVNGINNWFRLEFSVVSMDEDGNLENFLLIVKEITQMKQEEEKHREMIKALSSIYLFGAMIDLEQKLVQPIRLSGEIRQFVSDDEISHHELLTIFCENMLEYDYVDRVREFMNLDTLPERLQDVQAITCEYQGTRIGWGRIIIIPCVGEDDVLKKAFFAVQDVTEQKKREEWMQYKMEHDELTGTLNRTAFNRVAKVLQASKLTMTFVLLDIDKFKLINDTYGHDVGDEVLKYLVQVLNEKLRATDKIFRLGGDEFAIIMSGLTREKAFFIKDIIGDINRVLCSGTKNLPVFSVSAGITFSEGGYDESLYRNADQALYRTKETTRCGCTVYEEMNG